ncbi:hypothetical protein PLICRDRAFT_119732, partial [Plicaturopsis crispa FD-325 SS-3]
GEQTQNDFIRDYLPFRPQYLQELLYMEGISGDGMCGQCKCAKGVIRCTDCFGDGLWCRECCLSGHARLPFHRIQHWNGQCFVKSSLFHLGYLLHLGHGGQPCPSRIDSEEQWEDVQGNGEGGIDILQEDEVPGVEGNRADSKSGVMTVGHTTGVFQHRVRWCECVGAADHHLQLFRMPLFSASILRPRTAFTFDVLDHFYIDAMECKTAAMSFFHKLRRLTNNAFPMTVPNLHREIMRISRQWRDLQDRKHFGYGHDTGKTPGPGDLMLFCPACPQPGINLPTDWKANPLQWLFVRMKVVDGNFSAQSMQMRRPELDVGLTDGEGGMTSEGPYQHHLKNTPEIKQRSGCVKHNAINSANLERKNLAATGGGTCACGRHGAFVPHSMVDFQKGERQMNMDYAICEALNYHTKGLPGAIVVYDVACQWFVHFKERLDKSSTLTKTDLNIIAAIDKFHLGVHIPSCFVKFSLNFIRGAAQLDGAILETLWTPFNKTSANARAMSKAHRREVYNNHMLDSNWKKLIYLVPMLLKKAKRAKNGVEEAKHAFEKLTEAVKDQSKEWETAYEKAMMERTDENLSIFEVNMEKAPSQAQIRLDLASNEKNQGLKGGAIAWLASGIAIEGAQDSLRAEIRKMGSHPTIKMKNDIQERRRRLEARIDTFNKKGSQFFDNIDAREGNLLPAVEDNVEELDESEEDGETDHEGNDDDSEEDEAEWPEHMPLWMPSSLKSRETMDIGINSLASQERKLRQGQANDDLEELRLALGHKSLLYRTELRHTKSKKGKTRAFGLIKRADAQVKKHLRSYRRARAALLRLGEDEDIMEEYKEIHESDLKLSGDVSHENRAGQKSDKLAWFWALPGGKKNKSTWMTEFYRVNWLRAKARYERWEEEVLIVGNEMQWTVLWFMHQKNCWIKRRDQCGEENTNGHRIYAQKQIGMWDMFIAEGKRGFKGFMIPHKELEEE